jgi:hypothetical protein
MHKDYSSNFRVYSAYLSIGGIEGLDMIGQPSIIYLPERYILSRN